MIKEIATFSGSESVSTEDEFTFSEDVASLLKWPAFDNVVDSARKLYSFPLQVDIQSCSYSSTIKVKTGMALFESYNGKLGCSLVSIPERMTLQNVL